MPAARPARDKGKGDPSQWSWHVVRNAQEAEGGMGKGGSAKRYADELKIFPSAFVYSSFTLRSGEKLIYRVSQLGCHNMHQKRGR